MISRTLLLGIQLVPGSNQIFATADVFCSRASHISSLVPLGDEFSGFVVFMKLFRD